MCGTANDRGRERERAREGEGKKEEERYFFLLENDHLKNFWFLCIKEFRFCGNIRETICVDIYMCLCCVERVGAKSSNVTPHLELTHSRTHVICVSIDFFGKIRRFSIRIILTCNTFDLCCFLISSHQNSFICEEHNLSQFSSSLIKSDGVFLLLFRFINFCCFLILCVAVFSVCVLLSLPI